MSHRKLLKLIAEVQDYKSRLKNAEAVVKDLIELRDEIIPNWSKREAVNAINDIIDKLAKEKAA